MIDRLVCADGGNPDPTRTRGKDAALAKRLEIEGWDYPKHLAGRIFSIVVHGDAEGAGQVHGALSNWLLSMGLQSAGPAAELDRYIGYWKPYATAHEELDADVAVQEEVRRAASTLADATQAVRSGKLLAVTPNSPPPRQK
jgi:multimeric flavodoxin WrbA